MCELLEVVLSCLEVKRGIRREGRRRGGKGRGQQPFIPTLTAGRPVRKRTEDPDVRVGACGRDSDGRRHFSSSFCTLLRCFLCPIDLKSMSRVEVGSSEITSAAVEAAGGRERPSRRRKRREVVLSSSPILQTVSETSADRPHRLEELLRGCPTHPASISSPFSPVSPISSPLPPSFAPSRPVRPSSIMEVDDEGEGVEWEPSKTTLAQREGRRSPSSQLFLRRFLAFLRRP